MTNMNPVTGIRYGVIPLRDLEPYFAFEEFYDNSENLAIKEVETELNEIFDTIKEFTKERNIDKDVEIEGLKGSIKEDLFENWDESEDSRQYDNDGYKMQLIDDDLFIAESPYITFAPSCSPCAPGAAYLADAEDGISGLPAYCLPKEFFPNEKAPYEYLILTEAYDMLWGKIFPDEDMNQFMEYLKSTTTIPYMELKTLIMDAIQILLKGEENTDRGKFILGAVKTRIIHMRVVEEANGDNLQM